jgi:aspartate racemase
LLHGSTLARPGGLVVRLVDPTEVLARRCVAYALGEHAATRAASEPAAPATGRLSVESVYG